MTDQICYVPVDQTRIFKRLPGRGRLAMAECNNELVSFSGFCIGYAGKFSRSPCAIAGLKPKLILSSHLPPAPGMAEILLDILADAHGAP